MKENKIFKLGIVVLCLALISLCVLSGTFAKYTATVTGTDSARVAKFDYTVTGLDKANANINLFDTTADTGIIGNQAAKKLIAPGTEGTFPIVLTNKSEVAITATFELTETNAGNIPVIYGFDDGTGLKYYSSVVPAAEEVKLHAADVANVTIEGDLTALATAVGGASVLDAFDETKTITLNWYWAFEGQGATQTDITDTTLGTAGTAEITLGINCNIEQVDNI